MGGSLGGELFCCNLGGTGGGGGVVDNDDGGLGVDGAFVVVGRLGFGDVLIELGMLRVTMEHVEEQSWELTEKRGGRRPGGYVAQGVWRSPFTVVGISLQLWGNSVLKTEEGDGLCVLGVLDVLWAGEGEGGGLARRAGEAKPESKSGAKWTVEGALEAKPGSFS